MKDPVTDAEILQAMLDLVQGAMEGKVARRTGETALKVAITMSLKAGVAVGLKASGS